MVMPYRKHQIQNSYESGIVPPAQEFCYDPNRAERRHHMVRLKKIRCRYPLQAMEAKKHQVFAFVLPVFFLLDVWASTLS